MTNSSYSTYVPSSNSFENALGHRSSAEIIDISQRTNRVIIQAPTHTWWNDITNRMQHLASLPTGWDGYRASKVDSGTTYFALQLLHGVCIYVHDCPAPDIVPGFSGDLQIEWHTENIDIELHVRRANDVIAWRSKCDDTEGETLHLSNDFMSILNWIKELSSNATKTAA